MDQPHDPVPPLECTEFEAGLLFGLLVGEGHFGGDGRQPQITLRMHVRHEALFRWLERRFPQGRLYGPYHHGGRDYFQWMVRGPYLRQVLVPFLVSRRGLMDDYVRGRFEAMCTRYSLATEPRDPGAARGTPGRMTGHVLSSGSASEREDRS